MSDAAVRLKRAVAVVAQSGVPSMGQQWRDWPAAVQHLAALLLSEPDDSPHLPAYATAFLAAQPQEIWGGHAAVFGAEQAAEDRESLFTRLKP